MDRVIRGLHRFANPFTSSTASIGTATSTLEAAGEQAGGNVVDAVFARPEAAALGAAFDRFLADDRGTLALKKGLHVLIETRIHDICTAQTAAEAHGSGPNQRAARGHPLDALARRALEIETREKASAASPSLTIAVTLQMLALIARGIGIWLGGERRPAAVRDYRVGAPAFMDEAGWAPVRAALNDAAHRADDVLCVIADDGYDLDPGPGIPVLRAGAIRVERRRWWQESLLPALRLARETMTLTLRYPRSAAIGAIAWIALHNARKTFGFARLLHGVRFERYLDIAEYTASHIVKAALLERSGGRLVRWPHCIMDNPGAALSYLGYHHWLGTGTYEAENFGASWHKGCRTAVVGFLKNDRRWFESDGHLDPEISQRIAAQRAQGRRLLVYFGPSSYSYFVPVVETTVRHVLQAVVDRQDWCLVVKAKGAGAVRMVTDALTATDAAARLEAENRLIVVPYAIRGVEPCSAGWLIQNMDAAAGIGSVQLEALTQGKPCFSYLPVTQDTPYQRRLAACGLGHHDGTRYEAALARWMDDPDALDIPFDWFRDAFDPFADDRALDRVVEEIWGATTDMNIGHCARRSLP